MDEDDPQGLLQTVLSFFARKRPERSARPASLRSRKQDAWLRTDAFLQYETGGVEEIDQEYVARTLRALEDCIQPDSDWNFESDAVSGIHGKLSSLPLPTN